MERDWTLWVMLISGVIQALCAALPYMGVFPSMKTNSPRSPNMKITIAFMLLTWGAVAYDLYDRSTHAAPKWGEQPLVQVRDKKFVAQTVPLDGYEYINCEFTDVSFEFQGKAPSRLTDSRVYAAPGERVGILRSRNPVVSHTMIILAALHKAAGTDDPLSCQP